MLSSEYAIALPDLLDSINMQISRAKRDALDKSAYWAISCVTSMIKRFNETGFNRTNLENFRQSPSTVCLQYSPEVFEEVCKSYLLARQCLNNAPDGKMKAVLNDSLSVFGFICLEGFEGKLR